MIEVENLTKTFRSGLFRVKQTLAVDHVSFSVEQGKTLGLAGMSGSGKSTVARILMGLLPADGGQVRIGGQEVLSLRGKALKAYRTQVQMIFQNPTTSLNPAKRLVTSVMEPLVVHGIGDAAYRRTKVAEKFHMVGLDESLLLRYPHQISGGEAQRAMIARSLMLEPSVLILDEPTSMLDVSIQAQILSLLKELQRELKVTYLMISHDIGVLQWFCDDLAIMYRGEIVEQGPAHQLLESPQNPYTQQLIQNYNQSKIWFVP